MWKVVRVGGTGTPVGVPTGPPAAAPTGRFALLGVSN
jgi:hypothetical protein